MFAESRVVVLTRPSCIGALLNIWDTPTIVGVHFHIRFLGGR